MKIPPAQPITCGAVHDGRGPEQGPPMHVQALLTQLGVDGVGHVGATPGQLLLLLLLLLGLAHVKMPPAQPITCGAKHDGKGPEQGPPEHVQALLTQLGGEGAGHVGATPGQFPPEEATHAERAALATWPP